MDDKQYTQEDRAVEVLEYKDVERSHFGFQWTKVFEGKRTEAEAYIKGRVAAGADKSNFRTREKVEIIRRSTTHFRISPVRRIDNLSATEKKRRWDSGNPV